MHNIDCLVQVCKVEKSFGEAKSKILHVFDPKVEAEDGQPASSLAHYLEKQLGELLPMLGVKPLQVCSQASAHWLGSLWSFVGPLRLTAAFQNPWRPPHASLL